MIGCQTPLHVVERMLRDTPVWVPYCLAIGGKKGNPEWEDQPRTHDGSFMGRNTDDVSISPYAPCVIPISPRDRCSDAPSGNSTSYTVRRLEKNHPELLKMVKAGEISPNAAAVEAGFREREIPVPKDPEKAAKRLLRHFRGERLEALIHERTERLSA